MTTIAYFEIPFDNPNIKSVYGGSPKLLAELSKHLGNAAEIHISFFLYNNAHLHKFLEDIVKEKQCKVVIYTIPLEGYDDHDKCIPYKDGTKRFINKQEYANKIADRIYYVGKIELRFMPHTNVWSKQFFSRGKNSYALHNKSIMVIKNNGNIECLTTSSNLALGDPKHSENLFVSKRPQEIKMFEQYFKLLQKNSLSVEEYNKFRENYEDFHYVTEPIELKDEYNDCYFSAPFIKYEGQGSNHYIQNKIIDLIKSANKRLYVCAQHFSDISTFDRNAQSIVEIVGEKANECADMDIKILKQSRPESQMQGGRTAKTEKLLQKYANVQQRYWDPIIHDKFIIADNNLLITTANFTPTQFAWAYPHTMKYEFNNEVHEISNTFSDINSFHFLKESHLIKEYKKHFYVLWENSKNVF